MRLHRTNFYRDGHIMVTYCLDCGLESAELYSTECKHLEIICLDCGNKYWQLSCPNCKLIRLNFKKAVDSYK